MQLLMFVQLLSCSKASCRIFGRAQPIIAILSRSALVSVGISKELAKKTAKALDVNGDNSCEYLEFTAACLLSMEDRRAAVFAPIMFAYSSGCEVVTHTHTQDEFDELLRQEFRVLDVKRQLYSCFKALVHPRTKSFEGLGLWLPKRWSPSSRSWRCLFVSQPLKWSCWVFQDFHFECIHWGSCSRIWAGGHWHRWRWPHRLPGRAAIWTHHKAVRIPLDKATSLQEFCTYFGRPNVTYSRTLAQANDSAKLNGGSMKMPMKQHVRIVGGHGRSARRWEAIVLAWRAAWTLLFDFGSAGLTSLGRDEHGSNSEKSSPQMLM